MYKIYFLYSLVATLLCIIKADIKYHNTTSTSIFRLKRQTNGCELFPHPKHGSWKVFNSTSIVHPGMRVATGTLLLVTCNRDFELIGSNAILCNDDGWTSPIGQCLKRCPGRFSTSLVSVNCSLNNVPLNDCSKPIEGTIARFRCANFYEDESLERHPIHICANGKWSHDPPICEPRCGQEMVSTPSLLAHGSRNHYPWQVAIYNTSSNMSICGGSLINQRVILTAASCLTDLRGSMFSPHYYKVAVGKYYRKIDDDRDTEAQFSEVEKMFVPQQYKGDIQNFIADIGIIISKKIFKLSFSVQPVCVDWSLKYQHTLFNPSSPLTGYVSGWGFTEEYQQPSEVLKDLQVSPVSRLECENRAPENYEQYLTGDKFCSRYSDSGTSVCRDDSGRGLVFKYGRRFYLMGILSQVPSAASGGCDSQHYGIYTKVSEYTRVFILEIEAKYRPTSEEIECENNPTSCAVEVTESTPLGNPNVDVIIPRNDCILPSHPAFGQWNVFKSSRTLLPGSAVPSGTLLQITCNESYQLSGPKTVVCQSGNWSSQISECLKVKNN